jgi:beta-galactosidase/beta-glucuronidase
MLRCHIKVPDPLYLKVADEVGLLVWYEVPNWINFSDTAARYAEMTMDGMLERDWNHPSLVIVSIINESWGLDMSQQNHRDWLVAEYDRVKKMAKGRLVVDNSACWGNFHVKTDINDYHTYWAIPENRENFDNTVKEMAHVLTGSSANMEIHRKEVMNR